MSQQVREPTGQNGSRQKIALGCPRNAKWRKLVLKTPGRRTNRDASFLKPLPIQPNISAAPVSLGGKVKVNNDAAVCFAWQVSDVNLDLEYQAPILRLLSVL